MKKVYLLLVMTVLALNAFAQVWDGTTATAWTQGDGSEAAPYLIETPANLAYLSEQVNQGNAFEGKYFKLTNNLDMGGKEMLSIGHYNIEEDESGNAVDNSKYFKGTFDGDYKTIDNLLINKSLTTLTDESGTSYVGVGLFSCFTTSSVVRNLVFGTNSKVEVAGQYVGAIVGIMHGGLVENCKNLGSVSGQATVGGIIGIAFANSKIQYSANKGAVKAKGIEVGGIAAHIEGGAQVLGCYNTGAIATDYYYSGGVVGTTYDASAVKNCFNAGPVAGLSSPYISQPHAVIGDNDQNKAVTSDNYYVQSLSTVDNPATSATAVSESEAKAAAMADKLNNGDASVPYVADTENLNNGFPVFKWEVKGPSGISQAVVNGSLEINGRNISSTQNVIVRNLAGQIVASGKNINITDRGIYIISRPGNPATKILVK